MYLQVLELIYSNFSIGINSTRHLLHTNLNCKSWYIMGNCSPSTVHEGPNSIERDSINFAVCTVQFQMYFKSVWLEIFKCKMMFLLQILQSLSRKFYNSFIRNFPFPPKFRSEQISELSLHYKSQALWEGCMWGLSLLTS